MRTKRVTRYYADCGRGFWTKKSCISHEGNCTCWANPKFKTCITCKHGERIYDSDDVHHWSFWQCNNIKFVYDKHFTPAHEKAEDLCINCPIWEISNKIDAKFN